MSNTIPLGQLHDLALLYLGLAHGADAELAHAEEQEIVARLYRWQPDRDPALLFHVLRDAKLTYLDDPSEARIDRAIAALGASLPDAVRSSIVEDLGRIARADGTVVAEERSFIARLRQAWGLEPTDPSGLSTG